MAKMANGSFAPYSEGFCCECDLNSIIFGVSGETAWRTGLSCNLFDVITSALPFIGSNRGAASSAHCLRFNRKWYSLFELGNVVVDGNRFVISVFDDVANTTLSSVVMSNSNQIINVDNLANGGLTFVARTVGSFDLSSSLPVLNDRLLAVPSAPATDPAVQDPTLGSSLLLYKNEVDLSGRVCDKIGVSYEAFKLNQANACNRPMQSCLNGQIFHILKDPAATLVRNVSNVCGPSGRMPITVSSGSGRSRGLSVQCLTIKGS
jgi:hypothetical protein